MTSGHADRPAASEETPGGAGSGAPTGLVSRAMPVMRNSSEPRTNRRPTHQPGLRQCFQLRLPNHVIAGCGPTIS